jgi:TolB-like protein/Flp pilus assembly protein TadD
MKRCPECRRDYYDDTLLYCLDDGTELLEGPKSESPTSLGGRLDEPLTAILPESAVTGEAVTRAQVQEAENPAGVSASLIERSSNRLSGRGLLVAAALVVIVVCGLLGYRYVGSANTRQINSIAVLPFENRSGNPEADYLSDGLTDSLIFRFSQLPNLKVSPTSSVMRYKGKGVDVAEIAGDLGVETVLSGRLMQLGDDLTISVELVDARTKDLVWKEQYERKMADLLATQREIAATLTQKLQLRLAGNEQGITKKYTDNNEAYQLYLKGRYHWSRRTKEDILKAIDNYNQAIALDPNFALAYAATAEAYNSMGKNPDAPPKDCIPLAKQAATRALEIDPSLPQAHSALADSLALYDWDWAGSERHFKKALELDPNISYTYVAYGASYLYARGKTDEAVAALERAVALEPAAMIDNCILTTTYLYARKFDKALAQGRATYDLDPNFPFAPQWLGFALIANGKYDDAIALSRRVSPDAPFGWMASVVIGQAFASQGKKAEAEEQIAHLREVSKTRYVRPYLFASIYVALGQKDNAFAELERSFAERDCYLARIAVDPFMDPIRDDPRFKDLVRRMNLSE